ncbi:hypothetical protein [Pedobacter gandavensis]|uniref:Uncharacterized protein n=1 Tax=Pedobacter gandavensis TaxID=2679963 RepID=A0ABR6ERZ4_9SPHI|nr:hypothetical protein [Pedobacter gandavensis]MBB2148026.1 hypothetical protein [Pedobacter gandavensis]
MNSYADKNNVNKSHAVANNLTPHNGASKPTFQFVDNRPEAIAQRKLQELANNRLHAFPLKSTEGGTSKSVSAIDNKIVQLKEIKINGNTVDTDKLTEEELSKLLDEKDLSEEVKADLIIALYKTRGITFPIVIPNGHDHQDKKFEEEFKSGDLIYGRSENRAEFYDVIPVSESKYEDNIIDTANDLIGFADPLNYKDESDFNNNLDKKRDVLLKEIGDKKKDLESKESVISQANQFMGRRNDLANKILQSQGVFQLQGELKNLEFTLLHLEKSSPYIVEVFKWSNDKLFKGLESQDPAIDLKNPTQELIIQARTYRGCVRACKNGLTLAPNSTTKRIHFTLDDLDSSKVVGKEVKVPLSFFGNKLKGEPVTSKEVRAVSRFLSDNDSRVALNVIPYKSREGVKWPWEDPSTKMLWGKYIEQRKLAKELD